MRILRYELKKALGSAWLYVALALATTLSLAAACESYLTLMREQEILVSAGYGLGLHAHNYLGQTREGSFGNWIVVSANAPLSASLFFYALPLLAAMPYAWSYLRESSSGYAVQACVRTNRGAYIRSKMATACITGGLVALAPLVVNFIAVSCLFPAYQPLAEEASYVGLFDTCLFSELFYTAPFWYVAVYTALDTLLMGAWAGVVMGLSVVIIDRVKLLVLPFLFLLAEHFFNEWLFNSYLKIQGFNFNLLSSLRAESLVSRPELLATVTELGILIILCRFGAYLLAKKEVV